MFARVDSRSAPRSNSRTTDVLRFADHRPAPGSGPDSGDCSVALRAPSAAPESALFLLDMLSLLQNIFPTNVPNELSNEIPGRENSTCHRAVRGGKWILRFANLSWEQPVDY